MRRFDKPAKIMQVPAIIILLLAILPMTAAGQTKAPAAGTQRRSTAPSSSTAKKPSAKPKGEQEWLQEAMKDPEMMNEIGRLSQRLINEVQLPAARTESRILPRLSDSMAFYFAFPNFGQTLRQAQQIFQQELHDSATLRQFLHKNQLDAEEPKFEEELQRLYEISEYMGNEFVITGTIKGSEPDWVLITEVRKPGLKEFLEKTRQEFDPAAKEHGSILDPQQLATAVDRPGQEPVMLVRPDFCLMAANLATLRAMNAQLDGGRSSFVATPLGKKLGQSYQSGTSILAAIGLQKFFELIPKDPPQTRLMLEKTGFLDLNYALLSNRMAGKDSNSQLDMVFNGPRRGVASWIDAPAPLRALSFLSSKAFVAQAMKLKSPALIFDDIAEMAGPGAFAMLPQIESQLNFNMRKDILSRLTGEIGFEVQNPPEPPGSTAAGKGGQPDFKVVLGVANPDALQQTLKRLLGTMPLESNERVEDGVTITSLSTSSGPEVNYFFLDNYLVIASNRALAQEAVHLHRGGESLARSSTLRAQGLPANASVVVYQNSAPFLAAIAKQMPAEITGVLPKLLGSGDTSANFYYGYADETSLHGTFKSNVVTDASFGLIAAAIAIPNLLRSRTAANESAATSSLRTVNTAQVTYATVYPKLGYAPSLAVLGPQADGNCSGNYVTAQHACLLDSVLGNPSCTAGKWCVKSGYRFSVRGTCVPGHCSGYVVTATPVDESTGKRSFCSTVDAVIRSHAGPPLTIPLTAAACKQWEPL